MKSAHSGLSFLIFRIFRKIPELGRRADIPNRLRKIFAFEPFQLFLHFFHASLRQIQQPGSLIIPLLFQFFSSPRWNSHVIIIAKNSSRFNLCYNKNKSSILHSLFSSLCLYTQTVLASHSDFLSRFGTLSGSSSSRSELPKRIWIGFS